MAENVCGSLTLLQSAALMRHAERVFTNDSAPLHLASAVHAPTTAVFCSTVPAFGFGPMSDNAVVIETPSHLDCRPCGIHGKTACPEGHYRCANDMDPRRVLRSLSYPRVDQTNELHPGIH